MSIIEYETIQDVFKLIESKYPDWILDVLDNYSTDYPELTKNWNILCDVFKAKPQKILLVSVFDLDDHFSFAELLTQVGFIVRTHHEFHPCLKCRSAIPSEFLYKKLKEKNSKNIPEIYRLNCSSCS